MTGLKFSTQQDIEAVSYLFFHMISNIMKASCRQFQKIYEVEIASRILKFYI